MNVLVIDVGGTHVKVASSEQPVPIKIVSGPEMTAESMVMQVLAATKEWRYDAISIGYPGPVKEDRPVADPHNLGKGWTTFDYEASFHKPIRFINDAAMQALGGYEGGKMLFLGTGTGLGSALIVDGKILPLELAHLPYKHHSTYEEYLGVEGLERRGKKKWRKSVLDVIARLKAALLADYVLLGGGNAKLMKKLPEGVMIGANSNAVLGGIALWNQPEFGGDFSPGAPASAKKPVPARKPARQVKKIARKVVGSKPRASRKVASVSKKQAKADL